MYERISNVIGRISVLHARQFAVAAVKVTGTLGNARLSPLLVRKVMGLVFPSPLGLAAGFDKNGKYFLALPSIGFGFAEVGSVTPLPEAERSSGLQTVVFNLSRYRTPHPIPLGVSISMNRATPAKSMVQDYLKCFSGLRNIADYLTLNLGPRAGPDLHLPENKTALHAIFQAIKQAQHAFEVADNRKLPIAVKIDQSRGNTDALIDCIREFGFDAIVLSGSTDGLAHVAHALNGQIPIISVGGIRTVQDARERLDAGAALLQIYSGLVASGPGLVRRINEHLLT